MAGSKRGVKRSASTERAGQSPRRRGGSRAGEGTAPSASANKKKGAKQGDAVSIRLYNCNVYLIPAMMCGKEYATCTNHAERGRRVAEDVLSTHADIVSLQEMWGSAMRQVEKPLLKDGAYSVPTWFRSFFGVDTVDTLVQHFGRKGGLWTANKTETTVLVKQIWYHFSKSDWKCNKSCVASRIQLRGGKEGVSSDGTNKELIIVNTHLEPTNDGGLQLLQCNELIDWICTKVVGDPSFCPNPAATAVVCVGDFNFDHVEKQYGFLLSGTHATLDAKAIAGRKNQLKFRDLAVGHPDESIKTYCKYDNSLVMWDESRRIDMSLALDYVVLDGKRVSLLPVTATNYEVRMQKKGEELSDHWPVLFDIVF